MSNETLINARERVCMSGHVFDQQSRHAKCLCHFGGVGGWVNDGLMACVQSGI